MFVYSLSRLHRPGMRGRGVCARVARSSKAHQQERQIWRSATANPHFESSTRTAVPVGRRCTLRGGDRLLDAPRLICTAASPRPACCSLLLAPLVCRDSDAQLPPALHVSPPPRPLSSRDKSSQNRITSHHPFSCSTVHISRGAASSPTPASLTCHPGPSSAAHTARRHKLVARSHTRFTYTAFNAPPAMPPAARPPTNDNPRSAHNTRAHGHSENLLGDDGRTKPDAGGKAGPWCALPSVGP